MLDDAADRLRDNFRRVINEGHLRRLAEEGFVQKQLAWILRRPHASVFRVMELGKVQSLRTIGEFSYALGFEVEFDIQPRPIKIFFGPKK